MHGLVAWRGTKSTFWTSTTVDISPLYTWEDGRCDATFLAQLNAGIRYQSNNPLPAGTLLSTGTGLATLAHLHHTSFSYTHIGTIGDFMVWLFGERETVVMDVSNAVSWGCFDVETMMWDTQRYTKHLQIHTSITQLFDFVWDSCQWGGGDDCCFCVCVFG
jgi:sugar (pentulose or hexulose) kinase